MQGVQGKVDATVDKRAATLKGWIVTFKKSSINSIGLYTYIYTL